MIFLIKNFFLFSFSFSSLFLSLGVGSEGGSWGHVGGGGGEGVVEGGGVGVMDAKERRGKRLNREGGGERDGLGWVGLGKGRGNLAKLDDKIHLSKV